MKRKEVFKGALSADFSSGTRDYQYGSP